MSRDLGTGNLPAGVGTGGTWWEGATINHGKKSLIMLKYNAYINLNIHTSLVVEKSMCQYLTK